MHEVLGTGEGGQHGVAEGARWVVTYWMHVIALQAARQSCVSSGVC